MRLGIRPFFSVSWGYHGLECRDRRTPHGSVEVVSATVSHPKAAQVNNLREKREKKKHKRRIWGWRAPDGEKVFTDRTLTTRCIAPALLSWEPTAHCPPLERVSNTLRRDASRCSCLLFVLPRRGKSQCLSSWPQPAPVPSKSLQVGTSPVHVPLV